MEKKQRSQKNSGADSNQSLSVGSVSDKICEGLGGKENISDVDCCATRLRCTVHDANKVKKEILRATGASGVIQKGNGVQIIYGPKVTVIKSDLEAYLDQAAEAIPSDMAKNTLFSKNKGKELVIGSPYTGHCGLIQDIPDEAFASGMMGQGAYVEMTEPDVVAPVDGEISFVFDTKHALGIKTDEGVSLLIHVGIDTVNLKGQGFTVFVKEGDRVKQGDLLMRVDIDYVRKHAPSMASPILFGDLKNGSEIKMLGEGNIRAGENLLIIYLA